MNKICDKAIYAGANALIGIDVDYVTFFENMMGAIVNGTAVKVRKKETKLQSDN